MKIQDFLTRIKPSSIGLEGKIFILISTNELIIQSYKTEIVNLLSTHYSAVEIEYISVNEDYNNKSKEVLLKLNERSLFNTNKIIILEDNKGKFPISSLLTINNPQNFLILQSGKYGYQELQKFNTKKINTNNNDNNDNNDTNNLKNNLDLIALIELKKERKIIEDLVQYYLKKYIKDKYNFYISEISKEERKENPGLTIENIDAAFRAKEKNIIIEIIVNNLLRNNFSIEGEIQKLNLYFSAKKEFNSEELNNYYQGQNLECSIKDLCKGLFSKNKNNLFTELALFREDEYILVIRSLLKFINNIYKFVISFNNYDKEYALAEIKKVPFYDYYIYNYIIEFLAADKYSVVWLLEILPKALFQLMLLEKGYKSLTLSKKILMKEKIMEIIILFQNSSLNLNNF